MPLHPLHGHSALRKRLSSAIAADRLPPVILLEGPRGVGKQRLALWIAQRLACEAATPEGEPCGTCRPCHLVLGLAHPDVHWFVPVEPSKKSADADKQVELAEEAIGEVLAARRERPLYAPPGGMAAHSMAAIRLLLRRQALTPALGGPRVFILGDAERLIAQTGLHDASNALLKALEEPPRRAWFILTAADGSRLLPTILSRVVRMRVPRVADSVVTAFIQSLPPAERRGVVPAEAAAGAEGCIGRVLAAERGSGGGDGAAERYLKAARGTPVQRYAAALSQPPYEARGGFSQMLDGLMARLRREAAVGGDTARLVEAIAQVLEARAAAQGNVNPQLLAAVLLGDLAEPQGVGA